MKKVEYPYVVYHRPFGEAPYPVAWFAYKAHAGVFLRGLQQTNEHAAEHFCIGESRDYPHVPPMVRELQTA